MAATRKPTRKSKLPAVRAATPANPKPANGRASVLQMAPEQFVALRDLFWHNVVREMLTGLMVVAEKRPELLDGRFAVLTQGGERIPIAQVTPVFGMSMRGNAAEQQASTAVQMTVFRVATPDGEVFTLPVHEIRGFHELTPELLARLQQAEDMEETSAGDGQSRPFGLAAFQALPKLPSQAPDHPTE
jgi:hypothetical protein